MKNFFKKFEVEVRFLDLSHLSRTMLYLVIYFWVFKFNSMVSSRNGLKKAVDLVVQVG